MTIFSKIINGQIPSYKIYENDLTFAFLDINPIRPGHTLIVPKIEVDYFLDLPENYYQEVFRVAKILVPAIEKSITCQRVGLMVMGIDVPHFHLHLVPIVDGLEFSSSHPNKQTDSEELKTVQQNILKNLQNN